MAVNINMINNKDDVLSSMKDKISKALVMIGIQAERYAKKACVVDTGRLRSSISFATSTEHMNTDKPKQEGDDTPHGIPDDGELYLGTNVEYAQYVEFGARGREPKPFLRVAMEHGEQYKKITESVMRGKE